MEDFILAAGLWLSYESGLTPNRRSEDQSQETNYHFVHGYFPKIVMELKDVVSKLFTNICIRNCVVNSANTNRAKLPTLMRLLFEKRKIFDTEEWTGTTWKFNWKMF